MAKTNNMKSATFKLFAPKAKKVTLAGSFNNWDTKSLSARKDTKGNWTKILKVRPGRYEYKFFVDGMWMDDPNCKDGCVANSFGTRNCVIEIK